MNPWSFYENKPSLFEGLLMFGLGAMTLRSWSRGAKLEGMVLWGALAALLVGVLAVVDYGVYAFTADLRSADAISTILDWVRLPLFASAMTLVFSAAVRSANDR